MNYNPFNHFLVISVTEFLFAFPYIQYNESNEYLFFNYYYYDRFDKKVTQIKSN